MTDMWVVKLVLICFAVILVSLPTEARRSSARFESHETYFFNSCKKFDGQKKNYNVTCDEGELIENDLTPGQSIHSLGRDVKAIEKKVLQNTMLLELKEHVLTQIEKNIDDSTFIYECLKSQNKSDRCQNLVEKLREKTREKAPLMRLNMAMMSAPFYLGKQFGPFKNMPSDKKYNKNIKHPFRSVTVEGITASEDKLLNEIYEKELNRNAEDWFQKNKNDSCVEGREIKISFLCQRKLNEINSYLASKRNQERSDIYKNDYHTLLKELPHLALMGKASVPDSNEALDEILIKSYQTIIQETEAAKKKFLTQNTSSIKDLFRYPEVISQFLETRKPVSRVQCDMSDDFYSLYKDGGVVDWLETFGLVGISLVGGGICAFSGGTLCAVGVAVGAEVLAIGNEQMKLNSALTLKQASVIGTSELSLAKEKRDASVIYAPLAFVGFKSTKLLTTKRTLEKSLKEESKNELIEKYLKYSPTNKSQNKLWIDSAKNNSGDYYFDVSNTSLKTLNDSLGDKNLVTSVTNLHKEILFKKISQLKEKFPLEMISYSDFKSSRFSFKFPDGKIPEGFEASLKQLHQDVKSEFKHELDKMKKATEMGETDSLEWFSAGMGKSADEATLSSNALGKNFDEVKSLLEEGRLQVHALKGEIEDGLRKRGELDNLMETASGESLGFKLGVFEILRKAGTKSADELSTEIEMKFGTKLSASESQKLKDYYKKVDDFSPGLWVEERVVANLDDAVRGGFSVDFKGLGAHNLRQTSIDLMDTKISMEEAIKKIRLGEEMVTREFMQSKNKYQEIVSEQLKQLGIDVKNMCSGDDCVSLPTKTLSKEEQREVVDAIAQYGGGPANYRLSFIPENVLKDDRTQLAVKGELIEKSLRRVVTGLGPNQIPPKTLDNVIFAIDMPKDLSKSKPQLIMGVGPGAQLTDVEKELIQKHFDEVLAEAALP